MKRLISIVAVVFSGIGAVSAGQSPDVATEVFAVKDGQELRLDYYYGSTDGEQPCVIFMFGGAFARGTRDREDYIPYFAYLVDRGYKVVSIDYRLSLKDIGQVEDLTDELAAGMLVNSIRMAVDDLLDATAYVINNAGKWAIDTQRIVLNGSSAGAVTVLQAEYELSNGRHPGRLPAGFRYAGVMAFAGAVLTLDGQFSFGREPAPMLLMHGDADRQVPYGVLLLDDTGFYGSKHIAHILSTTGVPYCFYSFENYGHEIASVPIRQYRDEIGSFLTHFVENKEPLMIDAFVKSSDKEAVENKNFTIADYLNGNFGL